MMWICAQLADNLESAAPGLETSNARLVSLLSCSSSWAKTGSGPQVDLNVSHVHYSICDQVLGGGRQMAEQQTIKGLAFVSFFSFWARQIATIHRLSLSLKLKQQPRNKYKGNGKDPGFNSWSLHHEANSQRKGARKRGCPGRISSGEVCIQLSLGVQPQAQPAIFRSVSCPRGQPPSCPPPDNKILTQAPCIHQALSAGVVGNIGMQRHAVYVGTSTGRLTALIAPFSPVST